MDILDKIKEIIDSDAVKDITKAVGNAVNGFIEEQTSAQANRQAYPQPSAAAPQGDIIATGSIPPKPYFTVEEEYGDKKYSFELSRDFIAFNSHCEFDPSYQYEPLSSEEYTEYDDKLPVISIGPNDDIYEAAESFEENGTASGLNTAACDNPCFLFSTRFEEYGKKYYAYAFAGGTAREYEMLCVQYTPNIAETALETKLTAALDHAAATYKEENI